MTSLPAWVYDVMLTACLTHRSDQICTSFQLPSKGWTGSVPVDRSESVGPSACGMHAMCKKRSIGDDEGSIEGKKEPACRSEKRKQQHLLFACMFYDNKRLLPISLAAIRFCFRSSLHSRQCPYVLPFTYIPERYFLVSKLRFTLSLV